MMTFAIQQKVPVKELPKLICLISVTYMGLVKVYNVINRVLSIFKHEVNTGVVNDLQKTERLVAMTNKALTFLLKCYRLLSADLRTHVEHETLVSLKILNP